MPTLNWKGKEQVINLEVESKDLDYKYTFNKEDSGNKIIHGDNLLALKALLPECEGKVKCVYIDPPYNTGNQGWVYNDNVNSDTMKQWLGKVITDKDLDRHDKWLCMMYPRLKLLHKLLADDGAIFISIDDNEQANLKLLCDEIFGEKNCIRVITCVNNKKGRSDNKYIATAHEYILVYRKCTSCIMGGFPLEDKITVCYNKKDNLGIYREIDLRKTGDNDRREDRPNLFYYFLYNLESKEFYPTVENITPPNFIQITPTKTDGTMGNWRWKIGTAKENINLLIPTFMSVRKKWTVKVKDYLSAEKTIRPTSVWDFKEVNSERGTDLFNKQLGFLKSDFPNPKPIGTIERILTIVADKNALVLDSFAGSGTTAHAVLNLNKKDGGDRKFILIEMEDYAETITAERMRRVMNDEGFDYFELK